MKVLFRLLPIVVAVCISSVVVFGGGAAHGKHSVYVCPPCGCKNDNDTFSNPGKCPSCGMTLMEKGSGPVAPAQATKAVLPTEARDLANTRFRSVKKLARGVYEIRHPDAPDQFPQGNTTVVIGSRAVLVVDSCYLPSSAREDIAQIRKWTKLPVRYLMNTHWHFDHTMGNGEYKAAFPGIQIIAQQATGKSVAGYNPGWFARYPVRNAAIRKMLKDGVDADGKALTDNGRQGLVEELKGRDLVEPEFKKVHDAPPTRTFETRLDLDLGGRRVQLLCLGKGNTAGDALMFLPRERILAAGDLVDHPVPYLGGGFPSEQVGTLRRLMALHPKLLVPGHGEVLHGTAFVGQMVSFIETVNRVVSDALYHLGSGSKKLEQVRAEVMAKLDLPKWRNVFGGFDADNREFFESFSLAGLITASYAEQWRR